ncbi:MAG: amidohydrolase family protein, partial [Acidobacteriota bacterium]|nr:amidohydrolase family protein [Acidobacteriota bacterium]
MRTLIRNATILTMNDRVEIVHGAVSVADGRIVSVGPEPEGTWDSSIDAGGAYLVPGFIQTHIHLCQTLFRGYADDMPLLDWLKRCVWPMEAAHTPSTLRAATRLAAAELLLSGTTTVLTMETVHDTDVVFETLAETGMRAVVGKCMMDGTDEVPRRLQERTRDSIDESLALKKRWDGAANGRLHAAFAPRFAVSCSRELLEAVAHLSRQERTIVHTHASENREEVEVVRRLSGGFSNLEYLADTGLATPHLCAAHCVWVTDAEQALLAERDVKVLHCPGSNLKLGSGIAPVAEMRRRGISVSLGSDGAACNNRLDMFDEIRLA